MSTMGSTRVFQIYELAELITRFTIQRPRFAWLQGSATLVELARVNKTLSEISLRELWKFLHSGKPLVSLLPLDFVNYVEPAAAKQRFSREILVTDLGAPKVKAEHLIRYMKYSTYVHVLDIWGDNSATYELLKKADRCIVQLGLNGSHFRRRETLSISSSWAMDSQEYREMRSNRAIKYISISPTPAMESQGHQEMGSNRAIKTLYVVLQNTVQGPWLEEISRYYSAISTLAVRSSDHNQQRIMLKPESTVILDRLMGLKVLRVDIEPTAISTLLRKVRTLPLLKIISLRITGAEMESEVSLEGLALETSGQPLKVLRLEYEGAINNFHAILSISKALRICYEYIYYLSVPYSFQLDTAMVLGWILSTQPNIRAVTLSDLVKPTQPVVDKLRRTNQHEVPLGLNIMPEIMSRLAELRQLRYLRLNTFSSLLLTPPLLDSFASSLTLLESCIFTPHRFVNHNGNAAIAVCLVDIINFLHRCPNLRHMTACFDGRKIRNTGLALAVANNAGSQLSVLNVGHSSIDDMEYVASVLQKSLPALRQVIPGERNLHTSYIMAEVEQNLWYNVGRIIGGVVADASV